MSELAYDLEADVAVVGAGVVGLAVARAFALSGRDVMVFEAAAKAGTETSTRNSGVIHSGIYYPENSLKATLCVEGRTRMYEYCEDNRVPHSRLGKVIVATSEGEIEKLEVLRRRALANGVGDIESLNGDRVREREPALKTAVAGLYSPSTGIVDPDELIQSLHRDVRDAAGTVLTNTRVTGGEVHDAGILLEVQQEDDEGIRLLCNTVVNCAGLYAQQVAGSIKGVPQETVPEARYAKGHYFILKGKSPFSHLVYPLPVPGGLGIHATLDMGGQVRFGPDVEPIDANYPGDYSTDGSRVRAFYRAIKSYYPDLANRTLMRGYTGIRPQLGNGGVNQDFVIQGEGVHGVPGLINLYGIESPGLTASLAIARYVQEM